MLQAKAPFRHLDAAVGRLATKLPVGDLEPQARVVSQQGGGREGGEGGVGAGKREHARGKYIDEEIQWDVLSCFSCTSACPPVWTVRGPMHAGALEYARVLTCTNIWYVQTHVGALPSRSLSYHQSSPMPPFTLPIPHPAPAHPPLAPRPLAQIKDVMGGGAGNAEEVASDDELM